jgi:gliding motility-associated-like protein
LLLLGLMLASIEASATHIVGGEFELQHQQNYSYRLRLILYNDDIYGSPAAIDNEALVHIRRKRDHAFVTSIRLPYTSRAAVPYTNPDCVIPNLKTSKITYQASVTLSPEIYNDPDGYYITYERCCRNGVIHNIVRPGQTGQAFYLEFPPVVKEGVQFINSSPILFPPLSDFARLGYPFFFDFRGTDPDGDSLVYSMVSPLAGWSDDINFLPPSTPGPYPEVVWQQGYSSSNAVPGTPALRINKDGFLQVTPNREGLYVFSVMAEEFRDGEKIGEVRRDFQMLVYNYGGEDFPPNLQAEKPNGQLVTDKFVQLTEADFQGADDRCITLKVTDADAEQEGSERLRFRVIPLNFSDPSVVQLSLTQGVITRDNPELQLQLCLPECPPIFDQPYRFMVVAYDDVCSVPMTDTLRVEVMIPPPPNAPAYFLNQSTRLPLRQGTHTYATVSEGQVYEYILEGFDADGDNLQLLMNGQGFDPQAWGFSLAKLEEYLDEVGYRRVKYRLQWDASCSDQRDFSQKDQFRLQFSLDDTPECDPNKAALYQLNFSISVPGNTPPDVRASLNGFAPATELSRAAVFGQQLRFEVRATDPDIDLLRLRAVGQGFTLNDWGMSFQDTEGTGTAQGIFSWTPTCENLRSFDRNNFTIYFISEDVVQCRNVLTDTLKVHLSLDLPLNDAPTLAAYSAGAQVGTRLELQVGESLEVLLRGVDPNLTDGLQLVLDRVEAAGGGTVAYGWQNASGRGEVQSLLTFVPDCDLLQGASEGLFTFYFRVADDPCYDPKEDLLALEVLVREQEQDFGRVRYVNVFTPNGDSYNPYFEIKNLPEDACNNSFEYVQVYNRWGKLVFESNDRNFKWDAEGFPSGNYFYLLKYTQTSYRSPLTLMLGDQAGQ